MVPSCTSEAKRGDGGKQDRDGTPWLTCSMSLMTSPSLKGTSTVRSASNVNGFAVSSSSSFLYRWTFPLLGTAGGCIVHISVLSAQHSVLASRITHTNGRRQISNRFSASPVRQPFTSSTYSPHLSPALYIHCTTQCGASLVSRNIMPNYFSKVN